MSNTTQTSTTKLTIAAAGGATYTGWHVPADAEAVANRIRAVASAPGTPVTGAVDINPPGGPRCIIPMAQITMVIVEHGARPV